MEGHHPKIISHGVEISIARGVGGVVHAGLLVVFFVFFFFCDHAFIVLGTKSLM